MADEQYRWLDRETAERLLSGEPLEAVDAAAREQVEQLAETLGALAAPPPPTSDELPGEAAAMAAFRKVHAERGATLAAAGGHAGAPSGDIGVVRLGRRARQDRRRWGRPARFGLAAALAAGMLGGVAVAAGTGVLPSPFPTNEPEPAASVSAAETTKPLITPAPDGSARADETPGNSPGATDGKGRDKADGDGTGQDPASPGTEQGSTAERIASACRDLRDGKKLGADRKRELKRAAGGASLVGKYCEGVLAGGDDGAADGDDRGGTGPGEPGQGKHHDEPGGPGNEGRPGGQGDQGDQGGQGDQDDQDDQGGQGDQDDESDRGDQDDRSGTQDDAGEGSDGGDRTDSAAAQSAEPAPTPGATASETPAPSTTL
ncbi:hypothetical protein ABZ354_24590 [Streptomyces sp. NPDC005925]|uniref:hypothetical protein n=1 Tax=Streptomyces sp. NPDC005925 TaxID=3157172 RepID=UPI00340FB9BD